MYTGNIMDIGKVCEIQVEHVENAVSPSWSFKVYKIVATKGLLVCS